MAGIFGNIDLEDMIGKISSQFQKVMPDNPFPASGGGDNPFQSLDGGGGDNPFGSFAGGAGNPFGASLGGGGGNPFQIVGSTGENPFGTFGADAGNPFAGFGTEAGNPFGTFSGGTGNPFQNSFGGRPEDYGTKGVDVKGGPSGGSSGGGMNFAGPATADDNKGITGQQVDQFIASKFGNSPMVGQGQFILDMANKYGVSAMMILGIGWKESGMGTNVGVGNIFGITDPSRDGGLGGQRAFQKYGSTQAEIEAAAKLLATDMYKGKSAADQVSMWYVGSPYATSANSDDKAGNGTVNDYINNFLAPVYAAFGKGFQATQAPTRSTAPVNAKGMAFPVVGYTGKIDTHHGAGERGATDIFAPQGTAVVAMRGGTVIDAGWNDLGGNTVTIVGDDGMTYYYAHLYAPPLVTKGQKVQAGVQIGGVGDTGNAKGTGAHLHLGVGRTIQSGAGAQGGAGTEYDLVGTLIQIMLGGQ